MDDRGSLLCAGDRDVLVKRAYLHKDFKIQKKKEKEKNHKPTHTKKRKNLKRKPKPWLIRAFSSKFKSHSIRKIYLRDFPHGPVVKNLPCNVDAGSIHLWSGN